MEALEPHRVRAGLDLFVVPDFARKHLGLSDPQAYLSQLERAYPVAGAGDAIAPNEVQWVTGDHRALRYRGNVLKRGKMWLQRGDPALVGHRRYGYTGWQWHILPATADVARCAEVLPIADKYDEWAAGVGALKANHYIVTKYKDGEHSIGFHFDKPADIAKSGADGKSLIVVVKIGACARPFEVRDLAAKGEKPPAPFFSKTLAPGTAVIMTLEANLKTQHAVPAVDGDVGPSGSIVFRSIDKVVAANDVARELGKRRRE